MSRSPSRWPSWWARADACADALSASAAASGRQEPILLVTAEALPDATAQTLRDRAVEEVVLVGGTAAVSGAVEDAIVAVGATVTRLAGSDRYSTAALVAGFERPAGHREVWLATGRAFPDALAAGPAAAAAGAALLLVDPIDLAASPASRDWLAVRAAQLERVVLLGGPAAISANVLDQVRQLIEGDVTPPP